MIRVTNLNKDITNQKGKICEKTTILAWFCMQMVDFKVFKSRICKRKEKSKRIFYLEKLHGWS